MPLLLLVGDHSSRIPGLEYGRTLLWSRGHFLALSLLSPLMLPFPFASSSVGPFQHRFPSWILIHSPLSAFGLGDGLSSI